jgi:hypothetical protein
MFKKDNLKLGLILGLFAPILGIFGFYLWKFRRLSFGEFIQYLGLERNLLSSVVSFSLLANAVLFTIYINGHRDKTARGIFIVTCIYAVAALVLKFWFV